MSLVGCVQITSWCQARECPWAVCASNKRGNALRCMQGPLLGWLPLHSAFVVPVRFWPWLESDRLVALACPWCARFIDYLNGAKLGNAPGLCAPVISEGMPLAVCRAHCWVDYHCTPRFVVPVRLWPRLKSDMLVALACPWCARFIDYLNGAKLGNALRLCAPVLG